MAENREEDVPDSMEDGLIEICSPQKPLVINAIQSNIQLGSFYDRRSDNFPLKLRLWFNKILKRRSIIEVRKPAIQEDTFDDKNTFISKAKTLEIDDGIKVSLISGMVEAEGHLKHLIDDQQSKYVAKASLTYKVNSSYRELDAAVLDKVDYKNLLTNKEIQDKFTHVVVAIEYGGRSTVVIEKDVNQNNNKQNVQDALALELKSIYLSAEKNLKFDSNIGLLLNGGKFFIYSDMITRSNFLNWTKVLKYWHSLSKSLCADGGTPIKVWLLPKKFFGSYHETLLNELSHCVVIKILKVAEFLTTIINRYNDFEKHLTEYPVLERIVYKLEAYFVKYRTALLEHKLARTLMAARMESQDKSSVAEAIKYHDNSLFNKKCLTRWLDKLNTEATNMRSLHNAFTSDGFVLIKSVKEDVVVLHREIKVIFTLCLREENRAYLRQLKKYLKSMTEAPKENSDEAMEIEFQKWYENKLFLKRLNCMVYQLKKLAAAKKSNEKIDFFFRIVEAKGNPDSRAEIFMQLYIESVKYLPLVENLPVQTSHDAATIQWKHPTLGMEHVSGYRVVLKQVSIFDQKVPTQTVKVEEIRYSTEEEEKYIAYGLESRNMYHIAVHCIGYNFSFISQDVSADVVTLSSFPPCNFAEPFTKETKQANGPDFLEDTSQKLLLINALQSNFQLGYERRTNSFPPELKLKFKNTLKQLSINGVRKMSNQKYIFDDKNTFNSKTQALEKDDGIKESATNEVIDGAVKTVPVTHLCSLIATVIDSREVTLTWKPPNLTSQGSNLESYILKYKESLVEVEWKSISLPKEKDSYVFNQLLFGTEYSFKILGVYERNREVLLTETVNRKTVELDVPQIISVSLKKDSVTVIWNALTYEPLKYCIRYKLDDDWSTCFLELENVLMSYKKDKLLTKVKICCDKPRNYCFQIQSVCKFGESKWSEEFYHFKNEEEEDFPEIDGQCDDEDNKSFYHVNDVITECDIRWAIKHYGWVLEKNSSTPSKSKSIATMRLLQDIAKMKYQSFNIPLQWHDELGMHIAVNHPMDILHDVILKANFSLRSKLYQKLGFCHLSVPVLFPSDQDLYMNLSLKSIIVARRESDKLIEENVTKSPLCVISMMRIGQQAISSLSKSKLCNDLLGFNINSKLGSCGFYTRNALSSNTNRKTSEGTVEGIWYHNLSHTEKDFSKTFSLLNLRGDVLHHISSAASLASASDALFALCGEDMFKDDRHLDLLNALAENNSQSSLKKLVVLMTKESVSYVKSNRDLFKKVCSNVRYKIIDENYHKLLDTLTVEIEDTLEETLPKPSLNERFTRVAPEYISKSSTTKDVSESFLKELDRMKMSNAQERAQIRKNLFPIQSTIKRYTEAQKKETRTRNLDQKYKYRDKISAVKKEQLEIIQNGLPYHMSIFLKEISKSNCIEKRLRYLSDVKNYIDDWSFTHISDVRYQYSVATKELNLLKKKETNTAKDEFTFSNEQRDLQMRCDNLSIFLLDISIGVETIIREIGGIYETIYRNHDSLNKELNKCMNMLPEFAASLLLNGIALELLDGDGLSVPLTWLKEVFKVFKKSYMEFYELKHEPRIFVLTVLGTQSSGKSTLLNTMFGIQFPVSAGRCTKGAYLQLIPISLEGYKNDAILVVDTEGLGAPEYKNNNTHDNEIATFVLGISDVAIVNVRGELPNDIEDFLEVSICALMRMNMVDFHPKVVFVHQNCDPSAKQKNVTGRNTFMKLMDEVVVAQANIMQKRYRHFQDIVDISLEHDIFYFPQLMEGSGSMAPPNASYSKACSELRDHILTKMLTNKTGSLKFEEFCKKIETVWNGILEENFVLSLINNAEIQVRYEIENEVSIWKSKLECSLNENLEITYNQIKSYFKSNFEANANREYLALKINDFHAKSIELNNSQVEVFTTFIDKKTVNQTIFLKWKQRYIDKMEQDCFNKVKNYEGCIEKYFNDQQNSLEIEKEIKKSKAFLQDYTRDVAQDLLMKRKGEDINYVVFNEEECEIEFKKFWNDFIGKTQKEQNAKFVPANVGEVFKQELYNNYGQSAKFNSTIKRFGDGLESKFKVEWIDLSEHFQWKTSFLSYFKVVHEKLMSFIKSNERDIRFEVEDMISSAIHRIQSTLLCLRDIGGVKQMKFQTHPQFNCTLFVQQYLKKAIDILNETYSKAKCSEKFSLTNPFLALFACYAAQIAVENFALAQDSYLMYVDPMEKIRRERGPIKELFLSILRKEKDITIAARQIRSLLLTAAKKQALVSIRSVLQELVLKRITQKLHVHGLVLRDVVEIISKNKNSEEEISFLKTYFNNPFASFEDKISQVIDDNKEANINKELNLKLNAIVKKLKAEFLDKFAPHSIKALKVNICEYAVIKALGIGEEDFDNILTPKFEKRMENEKELIKQLASLLESADNNEVKLNSKDELFLKDQLKNDIKNHLFQCKTKCPFCRAPCNQTHADDCNDHSSRCHRPQGFGHYTIIDSSLFVIEFCNDLVVSDCSFKNVDTKLEWVRYKDYKSVGPSYLSWEIDGVASDHYLYWKYITYHVMQNLDKFYPKAVKKDVANWSGVTKAEAINVINNCFYLDGANVRTVNGLHIV